MPAWFRTKTKGFISPSPTSRVQQKTGTGIASTILSITLANKKKAPGAFNFYDMDDISFNTTYSSTGHFDEADHSVWFRDYGYETNLVYDDDAGADGEDGEPDVDTEGMSLLLSANQKTFFGDLLDDADDLFDFEGQNGDANDNLIDTAGGDSNGIGGDGWFSDATNTVTFARNDDNEAVLTNTGGGRGGLVFLAITTEAGKTYRFGGDLSTLECSTSAFFNMNTTASFKEDGASGWLTCGTDISGETETFEATSDTSYCMIVLKRSINGTSFKVKNLYVNEII